MKTFLVFRININTKISSYFFTLIIIIITFIPITRYNKHHDINLFSYFTHIIKYLLLMYLLYLLYFNLNWNKGDPQTELLPKIPLMEKKTKNLIYWDFERGGPRFVVYVQPSKNQLGHFRNKKKTFVYNYFLFSI